MRRSRSRTQRGRNGFRQCTYGKKRGKRKSRRRGNRKSFIENGGIWIKRRRKRRRQERALGDHREGLFLAVELESIPLRLLKVCLFHAANHIQRHTDGVPPSWLCISSQWRKHTGCSSEGVGELRVSFNIMFWYAEIPSGSMRCESHFHLVNQTAPFG